MNTFNTEHDDGFIEAIRAFRDGEQIPAVAIVRDDDFYLVTRPEARYLGHIVLDATVPAGPATYAGADTASFNCPIADEVEHNHDLCPCHDDSPSCDHGFQVDDCDPSQDAMPIWVVPAANASTPAVFVFLDAFSVVTNGDAVQSLPMDPQDARRLGAELIAGADYAQEIADRFAP